MTAHPPLTRCLRWGLPAASLTLSLTLLSAVRAHAAEPVVEKLDHAEIDWTAGVVLATGSGAPNLELPNVAAVRLAAERTAKLDAYRHILEALEGVRVTVEETGRDRLRAPQVRAQVQGVIRGCKVKDTRYYSDGGVDVVLRCPFGGGLATALAPAGERTSMPTEGDSAHTGLVVDASGTDAKPALVPTLAKADGTSVFGPKMVMAEALRKRGAVVYVKSLADAKGHPRVGKNPVVLNVRSTHPKKGWIVSDEEATKLEGLNLSFLSEGRVAVVIAPEAER